VPDAFRSPAGNSGEGDDVLSSMGGNTSDDDDDDDDDEEGKQSAHTGGQGYRRGCVAAGRRLLSR